MLMFLFDSSYIELPGFKLPGHKSLFTSSLYTMKYESFAMKEWYANP